MKEFCMSKSSPVVQTPKGKLRGFRYDGVDRFHGIRYAKAKRFQMPEPVPAWEGVKDAGSYGMICPVLSEPMPTGEVMTPHRFWPSSEHCQYLNVWTDACDPAAKKPVLFWIHGGGYSAGSSIEQVSYDGFNLAKKGGVVVSVNHRLNAFGYLVMLSDGLLGVGENVLAIIMGHIGSQFVSANAITLVVQRISTIFITGISFSSCFIIGKTLGEGSVPRAQKQGNTFLILGLAIGAAAGGIIFLISGPMVGFYDVEAGTKDIALQLMDALSLIAIFRSANSILTKGVLRGGGDTRFLVAADTLTMWCFAIPLGALAGLVLHLPAFWVFLLLHIDQIIKAVWCVFRLKSGKWVKTIHGAGAETS